MGFSEKIKLFFESKGLNNREVGKLMEDYSEVMISNYNNSDNWKDNYIKKLVKYFPDIDLNALLKDDQQMDMVTDVKAKYKTESLQIVEDLEVKIKELKKKLSL